MFFRKPSIIEKDKTIKMLLEFGYFIVYAVFRIV